MSMKKRILSALLALCLTGSLAGTALAAGWQATPETARAAARQVEDTPAAPAAQPDATQPLPDEAKDGLWMRGGSHDAFHNLHFTEPGDYLYYVRQTPGDTPYMTYDDALYTVVVQVTNHRTSDGMGLQYQIFASRHDDPGNKVAEVRFLNTYAPPAATPTPAPAGTLPQTGDSLPLGLLVGLAVAAAAAVVVLVVLRRRKK